MNGWVCVGAAVVVAAAVVVVVLLRARRRADLADILAGKISFHPVPIAAIYDALDQQFLTAAALLQPDGAYQPGAWDRADEIAFERDCATYRYDHRLPGERAL